MKYIKQYDQTDCGPACLAMIASHYHLFLRLSEIRKYAGTDTKGTNLTGMIQAGRKFNFHTTAVKGSPSDIQPSLHTPFIAHIKKLKYTKEIHHYIVIKKISKNYIHIYDPAQGKMRLTYSDFFQLWTGIAIVMIPSMAFEKRKKEGCFFFSFLSILKYHLNSIILVAIASLILSIVGIISSLLFGYLIDEVFFIRSFYTLHIFSIGILMLTFIQGVMSFIRNHLMMNISLKIDTQLIFSYLRHILNLPVSFFDARKMGEILSRLDDSRKIKAILSDGILTLIMDFFMVIIVGLILFFKSSSLFFIQIIASAFAVLVSLIYSRIFGNAYRQLMDESSDTHSFLVEIISGINTVKSLNATKIVLDKYEKYQMKVINQTFDVGIKKLFFIFFSFIINGWSGNIIFWAGSYLILKDRFTIGQLFSFNALLVYFTGPLKRLLTLQPTLQEGAVAADRLGEIFDIAEEIPQDGKWITPAAYHGFITAENITFRYGTRRPVLNGVSFTVNAGERVAFVGASGCGKTTLIKLLLKFYSPESGSLSIDQYNIEDIDTKHLRAHIGYVPQEVFLFSGTIAENIALHKPEASLEEIIEASIQTGVHSFVEQLPARYNTVLSERGMSLSGGERQRIALARALLSQPDILIFDEATSSLDTLSERHIHQVLESLKDKKRTTVMIAHRLTTVVHCDRIFVMDKGCIIESGTHTELLEHGGLYSRLWNGETV